MSRASVKHVMGLDQADEMDRPLGALGQRVDEHVLDADDLGAFVRRDDVPDRHTVSGQVWPVGAWYGSSDG